MYQLFHQFPFFLLLPHLQRPPLQEDPLRVPAVVPAVVLVVVPAVVLIVVPAVVLVVVPAVDPAVDPAVVLLVSTMSLAIND